MFILRVGFFYVCVCVCLRKNENVENSAESSVMSPFDPISQGIEVNRKLRMQAGCDMISRQ